MKKVVLFALLFAAVAASAYAVTPPLENRLYKCDYTNPTMGEVDPGFSRFDFIYLDTPTDKRGIEYFDATWGQDNRKVTFAKPVDGNSFLYGPFTTWEFTINPYGPQCKRAAVLFGGHRIDFSDCSDGHSRICTTYY
ncbi:MAG TPA: hypothetical protein VGG03_04560 [Thermoanaerobaculia bacterium]|jgi:hypothetical protein